MNVHFRVVSPAATAAVVPNRRVSFERRLTFSFAGGTMLQCEAAPMLNRLRGGGSLVELLISLGIIGALVGLVLTAAMSLLNAVNRLVQ